MSIKHMTGGRALLTGTAALLPHLDMACRYSAAPATPSLVSPHRLRNNGKHHGQDAHSAMVEIVHTPGAVSVLHPPSKDQGWALRLDAYAF